MAEFGLVVAKGAQNVDRLREQLERLPKEARTSLDLLFDQLADTDKRIERLGGEIKQTHEQDDRMVHPYAAAHRAGSAREDAPFSYSPMFRQ